MLARQVNKSKWDEMVNASPDEEYDSLLNVLRWTDGFGLVFVQCSPVRGVQLIEQVRKDLPTKRIESMNLSKEIENLYEQVKDLPEYGNPDILFIQGIENSFIPYLSKTGYGGQGDYYRLDTVPPILNHLNLQRERYRNSFKINFIFLLPPYGLKYFIQRAPDFFDWRSGMFEIATDRDLAELETSRLLREGDYDKYLQWSFSKRVSRILEIETLLNEEITPEQKALLLFEQGNLWAASPQYEESIDSYDKALQIKPDFHQAWFNRGVDLRNLGRYEESIKSYDKALQIKPDFHQAWNNRGVDLRNLGRYEEAIDSYQQSLKFLPNDANAYYNIGCDYALQGNIDLALENLQQAIQLNPDKYLEEAKTESDFDSIRHDPRFQALIQ